jgi:cytochrome c
MDSLEVNKGIAALLVGGIAFFLTGLIGDALVRERLPEKPVLNIAAAPTATTGGGEAKPAGPGPIAPLLASADPKNGEAFAKKVCVACHTFDKGGKDGVGPNLYGVVGDKKGEGRGFNFSAAMKAKGGEWSFDDLNKFIANPKGFVPGTAMGFAGITKDSERADVIDYLHTLADSPVPLPTAAK